MPKLNSSVTIPPLAIFKTVMFAIHDPSFKKTIMLSTSLPSLFLFFIIFLICYHEFANWYDTFRDYVLTCLFYFFSPTYLGICIVFVFSLLYVFVYTLFGDVFTNIANINREQVFCYRLFGVIRSDQIDRRCICSDMMIPTRGMFDISRKTAFT